MVEWSVVVYRTILNLKNYKQSYMMVSKSEWFCLRCLEDVSST